MKKSLILLIAVILFTQSFVQMHAQDTPMYKAHFLTFTETLISRLETQLNLTREEAVARQLKTSLQGEAQLKKSIKDRIPDFNGQWVFFGPNHLQYQETSKEQTITDMYGAFHDSAQPIYQALENLKTQYYMQNINPYIITESANFVKKSENIMIRNVNDTYPWANFLKMITPSTMNNPLEGFKAPMPENYPGWASHQTYGTLGQTLVHKVFEVFEYKGDSLVYFQNDQGQLDSAVFSMGDRNVVDLFAWDNVFDNSGTDLGFHTNPDTLTIVGNLSRHIELYPGWNDENTGKVLYTGGDHFYESQPIFADEYHCRYSQSFAKETEVGAYAVAINGIDDAFAMDYILVQFVEEIEYPTLQTLDNIKVNDEFTVSLSGNPELMTSWIPEITISGIEYEFIKSNNYTYTYKALSEGTATVVLHNNSLLVLDDDVVTFQVNTDIQRPDAPQNLSGNLTDDGIHLSWTLNQNEIYNIYRSTESGKNYEQIAENINTKSYIDDTPLSNGNYYYVITAQNEAGESDYSNEVEILVTSVTENTDTQINITPNPAEDYIEISIDGAHLEGGLHLNIAIYDLLGNVVWKSTPSTLTPALSQRAREHRIDISNLPSGVYFVRIGVRVEKFVKR